MDVEVAALSVEEWEAVTVRVVDNEGEAALGEFESDIVWVLE